MKEKYLSRLRPCPFCHKNSLTFTWIDPLPNKDTGETYYVLSHFCHPEKPISTCVSIYGATEAECVERWNADGQEHIAK